MWKLSAILHAKNGAVQNVELQQFTPEQMQEKAVAIATCLKKMWPNMAEKLDEQDKFLDQLPHTRFVLGMVTPNPQDEIEINMKVRNASPSLENLIWKQVQSELESNGLLLSISDPVQEMVLHMKRIH